MVLVVIGGLAAGAYALVRAQLDDDERRPAVVAFTEAWERGDYEAMYRLVDAKSRQANPKISFLADYKRANRAATVEKVRVGKVGPLLSEGIVKVPVTVDTDDFGPIKGELEFKASEDEEGVGRVAWTPALRLPGLKEGEDVTRKSGATPTRGNIYAAGGKLLDSDDLGASIAGVGGDKPTGLNRVYDDRLAGKRSSTLRFGDRVIARVKGTRGKSVTTSIQLGLQQRVNDALGDSVGGVAVIRPKDGKVLALAGLAVSAPQPPGSVFKVVTAAAALHYKKASMSSSYPARQFATLSGAKLRNAGDSACGGSFTTSFANSCNSVFGPLGAKVGAKRLVRDLQEVRLLRAARHPRREDLDDPRGRRDEGRDRRRLRRDRPEHRPGDAAPDGLGGRDDRQQGPAREAHRRRHPARAHPRRQRARRRQRAHDDDRQRRLRHRQGRADPRRHRRRQDRHGRARLHRRHRPERREHHRLVRRLRPARTTRRSRSP